MISMEPGWYMIGDPCYVVPSDDWVPLLEKSDYFRKPVGTTPDGKYVVAFGTEYGDGIYSDNEGNAYSVDAGIIGIVNVDDFDDDNDLMTVHEFVEPFTCYKDGPVLHFGHIIIDTD